MQDSQIVRMELKYCECCGGLLLRHAGTTAIYCAGCAARVRELAPPRMPKFRGRGPVLPRVEAEGASRKVVKEIHAVAASVDEARQTGIMAVPFYTGLRSEPGRAAEAIFREAQKTRRTA